MPLDPSTEMKTPEKKEWPVIPEDVYQVEITDLTAEESEYKGEKKDVFKFEFTIIEDGPYYGRKLWKKGSRVSPLPSEKNKPPLTWKVCSAVAKHAITEDEGKAYTIQMMNALIGKQIRLGVVVTPPKDGKQYNNADGFYATKTELPKFDESKVNKDEPTPQQKATPADIVQQVGLSHDSELDYGTVDPDDLPY